MTIAVALTVAACSPDEASVARPFEEVQATEFVFEADPTDPMRGIFRVDTTEAMICAIVWGETEALGNLNNSLAMNGTGIIKHDVFLPRAEQGVEYFYRVQGTTADGTFYQSELMTFTIPVSDNTDTDESDVVHGINVAERAVIVEVSSEFSSAWSAANAVDGDLATEWSSAGDGDGSFITIDLGQVYHLIGVEFLTRSMADGSATTETFYVVGDDSERLGPFEAGNPAVPGFAPIDISTQTLRFEVESTTGGNTGAIEVRAFAETTDG